MKEENLTDTSDLEELMLSRKWQDEQIDRLLAWEFFTRHITGKIVEGMQSEEFCDTIGVGPRYTKGVNYSIQKKAKQHAERKDL